MKWEYKRVNETLNVSALNTYGLEGWELVAMTVDDGGFNGVYMYGWMKRPILVETALGNLNNPYGANNHVIVSKD